MTLRLLTWSGAFLLGGVLGILYFTGLWITVNYLPRTRRPLLYILLSFILRTFVLLAAFYFIMGSSWERLFFCLGGFILARVILFRRMKR